MALKADVAQASQAFESLLESLANLLPCDTCLADYNKYLSANKPMAGKAFSWTVDLHNAVNKKLGYPEVSLEDARARWAASRCSFLCSSHDGGGGAAARHRGGSWFSFQALLICVVIVTLLCYKYAVRSK
jgi:hypothetical protein